MVFQLDEVCKTLGIEKTQFFPEAAESFFEYKIVEDDFWSVRDAENDEKGDRGRNGDKEKSGQTDYREITKAGESLEGYQVEGCQNDENKGPDCSGELYFKNVVKVVDYPSVVRELPPLSEIQWKDLESIPYFVSGLEHIREAVSEGRPTGIEGGPCLFGAWEVFMELTLRDGTVKVYDFNLDYLVEDGNYIESQPELPEAMQLYADDIVEIHFRDKKDGLTGQEIASVQYLFEVGAALDSQVILSIPDFSYVKYLEALLAYLETGGGAEDSDRREQAGDPGAQLQNTDGAEASKLQKQTGAAGSENRAAQVRAIQEQCREEFRAVAYRITDLYLELVEHLKGLYPDVKFEAVHERRADLCDIYYEKRAPHIERNKILRLIRSAGERHESLKDYISLSALPYYLFGITDILHVCNLDEVDSYQKCRKAHKGTLNLACLLYPEYASGDGENIVFYAKKQYKDYYPDFRDYFKENDR